MVATLNRRDVKKTRILIPRAEVARELLPDELRAAGAHVNVVPRVPNAHPRSKIPRDGGKSLWIIQFMLSRLRSSSTVRNFVAMLGGVETR